MKSFLAFLIKIYQKTLSPDHSFLRYFHMRGTCKFHPTCSEYALQALQKHLIPRAAYLAAKRVLRCNPLSGGGVDEP